MSCLVSKGSVSPRDLIATLLDLARKKHLLLTTVNRPADGLFRYKDTLGFIFEKNSGAADIPLKEHESFLIDWFINQIGDGCCFSLDQVNDHISDERYSDRFRKSYVRWRSLAEEEAGKIGFFLRKENYNTMFMIYCVLGIYYFVMGMFAVLLFGSSYGALNCCLGLILFISALFTKLTVFGYEQRAKWLAFKRFITDFSQIENADIRSVGILERYLVYAISLGAAKNVIAKMPLLINYSTYDSSHPTLS
jgi:uncharacterized membrane protein